MLIKFNNYYIFQYILCIKNFKIYIKTIGFMF